MKETYFRNLESTSDITHERFDEALAQLSIHNYTQTMTLKDIEEAYLRMIELVTEGKRSEIESQNRSTSIQGEEDQLEMD